MGPHSSDDKHQNDDSAKVTNNLNVVFDGHDASVALVARADYTVLSGKLSRRLRKVMVPWDGPHIRTAVRHFITPVGTCTARVEFQGRPVQSRSSSFMTDRKTSSLSWTSCVNTMP